MVMTRYLKKVQLTVRWQSINGEEMLMDSFGVINSSMEKAKGFQEDFD